MQDETSQGNILNVIDVQIYWIWKYLKSRKHNPKDVLITRRALHNLLLKTGPYLISSLAAYGLKKSDLNENAWSPMKSCDKSCELLAGGLDCGKFSFPEAIH